MVGVFAIGAVLSIVGARVLAGSFRDTAEELESRSAVTAQLRSDMIAHASVLASEDLAADLSTVAEADVLVRRGFDQASRLAPAGESRQQLQQAREEWENVLAAVGTPGRSIDAEEQAELGFRYQLIFGLLDASGAAALTDARHQLADAARLETFVMIAMAAVGLAVVTLMVGLGRRLSREVLCPITDLRTSANRLRDGDLKERVVIARHDELGELAASFNAMAEAIDDSHTRLEHQATHDSLTGLHNRAGFRDRLEASLRGADQADDTLGVLFVDLDDFKEVNDTLGHAAGDELLRLVARRLVEAVRPVDLVARLGGDEFAVLLGPAVDAEIGQAVGERLVDVLAAPQETSGVRMHVGASVGLAIRRPDSDADSLMMEADVAMYLAKARGKNRTECYVAAMPNAPAGVR
jgi:diguanylate cyclase (GGDEF)-like protein